MIDLNNRLLCESCLTEVEQESQVCPLCGYSAQGCVLEPGVLQAGEILAGKYLVGKTLGRGGFGITYLGYDIRKNRKVAIKEYLPEGLAARLPGQSSLSLYPGDKEQVFRNGEQRFFDEARMISRFNSNPNIIGVYEFFKENSTSYYVMEYIEGMDLKKYVEISEGRLPVAKAAGIIIPVMDALILVHREGILHRDISPDNIYISREGNVKLLDFGAARQVLGEQSKSLSIILKHGFAPLEQYQSKGNFGPWSDIYSLGATFYYAITGAVQDPVMDRLERDQLRLPSQLGVSIASELEQVLLRSLSIRAEYRQQTMSQFKAEFLKALSKQYNMADSIPAHHQEPVTSASVDKHSLARHKGKTVSGRIGNTGRFPFSLHGQHGKNNRQSTFKSAKTINNSLAGTAAQTQGDIFSKRLFAYAIDLVLYMLFVAAGYTVVSLTAARLGMVGSVAEGLFLVLLLLSTLIYVLILANLEASKRQATLGKMLMGLKVVDIDGGPISSRQSLIRSVFKLLGIILLLTENNGRYLHEIKSKSNVTLK